MPTTLLLAESTSHEVSGEVVTGCSNPPGRFSNDQSLRITEKVFGRERIQQRVSQDERAQGQRDRGLGKPGEPGGYIQK